IYAICSRPVRSFLPPSRPGTIYAVTLTSWGRSGSLSYWVNFHSTWSPLGRVKRKADLLADGERLPALILRKQRPASRAFSTPTAITTRQFHRALCALHSDRGCLLLFAVHAHAAAEKEDSGNAEKSEKRGCCFHQRRRRGYNRFGRTRHDSIKGQAG